MADAPSPLQFHFSSSRVTGNPEVIPRTARRLFGKFPPRRGRPGKLPGIPFFRHFVIQAGFLTMEPGYHGLSSEKFDKFGDDLIRRFFH
jgi:hypothetical protein